MTTLVSCYGGQPAEAVLRGMYYAGRLERRFGLRFSLAVAMENQTLPLGLASLWSGSGARYSWRGVCACASRIPTTVHRRRPHEIYWYTGLDGGRILMKWHSLAPSGNKSIGGYAEAFDPVAAVEYLDANAEFLRRYRASGAAQPYSVRGAFGFGWDALDRKTGQPYQGNQKVYPLTEHFHIVAKKQTTAQRQVISSNEEDFFRDFESRYQDQLPTESVTYGNEWELYSASMAETSSRVRRSVEKLRPAELMATLVSLEEPDFLPGRETARDLAFTNLGLYWEHDWTADGPVPRSQRAAWQERLADEIEDYVDGLHADAAERLGTLIRQPEPAGQRFYVLNPLGWTRTDYADFAYQGAKDIHVRDVGTGNDVPHQFVRRDGVTLLRRAGPRRSFGRLQGLRDSSGHRFRTDRRCSRDRPWQHDDGEHPRQDRPGCRRRHRQPDRQVASRYGTRSHDRRSEAQRSRCQQAAWRPDRRGERGACLRNAEMCQRRGAAAHDAHHLGS